MAAKAIAKVGDLVGAWAFLIGVILAVIIGAVAGATAVWTGPLLVVLGIIVGILNVQVKEVNTFLLAGVSLVIVSSLSAGIMSTLAIIGDVLNALLLLFVPATVIVALKSVFSVARR